MNDQRDTLSELYTQHKQRHSPPDSLRRYVLQKARNNTARRQRSETLRHWRLGVAAAVSMLALVTIWGTSYFIQHMPKHAVPVALVQYHGFDADADHSPSFASRRAEHFNAYQHRQLVVRSRYEQTATVIIADGTLALEDCRDKIFALSASLVAALHAKQKLPADLQTGERVSVAFNQDGYILEVIRSPEPLRCESA